MRGGRSADMRGAARCRAVLREVARDEVCARVDIARHLCAAEICLFPARRDGTMRGTRQRITRGAAVRRAACSRRRGAYRPSRKEEAAGACANAQRAQKRCEAGEPQSERSRKRRASICAARYFCLSAGEHERMRYGICEMPSTMCRGHDRAARSLLSKSAARVPVRQRRGRFYVKALLRSARQCMPLQRAARALLPGMRRHAAVCRHRAVICARQRHMLSRCSEMRAEVPCHASHRCHLSPCNSATFPTG